ncbi:hypothetical protein BH20VER2_BH20VER2_08410 [soil metagenome]
MSSDVAELREWLAANGAPVAAELPPALRGLKAFGCKMLSWEGRPVSIICLTRGDGGLIDLVMTSASSGPALPPEPQVVQEGPWAIAAWRAGDMACMLALHGDGEQLRRYL